MYALCIWNCGHVMMTWIENSCCCVFLVLIAILIATCLDLNRWIGSQITQHDGFGHEKKYHRCFLWFKWSSRRLNFQRGREAGGGSAVVGKRCKGRSCHWFWEIDHVSKPIFWLVTFQIKISNSHFQIQKKNFCVFRFLLQNVFLKQRNHKKSFYIRRK